MMLVVIPGRFESVANPERKRRPETITSRLRKTI
jgi:hypothetical protein